MLQCDASGVLKIILLVKNMLQIIQIAAPIILIVFAMIDIVKLIVSAMDKTPQIIKKIINRFLAAVIVFLVPVILNTALSLLGEAGLQSTDCWINANEEHIKALEIQEQEVSKAEAEAEDLARQLTSQQKDAIALALRKTINFASNSDKNGGGVLIIAGHASSPECDSCNDCRGKTSSGYAEETETRSLALSLKKALLAEDINAVIANQLLTGDTDSEAMEASFLCARSGSGGYAAAFQTLENEGYWSTFSHVIEIHFNAAGSGAYGTELITNGGETEKVSSIGKSILDKVSSYTGYNRQIQGFSGGTLGNWNFFQNQKGIDTTYIEVEFYDNAVAMGRYKNNQEKIAKDIAKAIKGS
ncbi:MAG: N-acetylmuramoyl-L-alanine amidase [Bacilli bacterium]|nr:N-acetylmuramoyl-L-alanine amidase [Bacilli bacterium]